MLPRSRELKRLDSTTRSPIYSGFSELLDGLSTVRAFGKQALHEAKNDLKLDDHTKCELALWTSNRWLVFRLQLLSGVIFACVALYAVLASEQNAVPPVGTATALGLVLLYATQWVQATNQVVRQHATVEQMMNYVERCDEYANLDREEEAEGSGENARRPRPTDAVSTGPPFSAGGLDFVRVTMKYASSPRNVLSDVSFAVPPRTRCGVVGRTGAGKSSLVNCLFRVVPLSSGSVVVDGVDVATLPLRVLRRHLAIIPQAATLFSGDVRTNLDPHATPPSKRLKVSFV